MNDDPEFTSHVHDLTQQLSQPELSRTHLTSSLMTLLLFIAHPRAQALRTALGTEMDRWRATS